MSLLATLTAAALIAIGAWALIRRRRATLDARATALLGAVMQPLGVPGLIGSRSEKTIPGHAEFLDDLKRREREALRQKQQPSARRVGARGAIVIDAEFHAVANRDPPI